MHISIPNHETRSLLARKAGTGLFMLVRNRGTYFSNTNVVSEFNIPVDDNYSSHTALN